MDMAKIAGSQVIVMFLLMGVGFFLSKRKIVSDSTANDLNKILISLVSPCLIISAYNRPFDASIFHSLLIGFLLAFISHGIAILLAFTVVRGKDANVNVARFAVIFSNAGFMGFPLISAMLGPDGIIFASAYLAVFTFVQWTAGVLMLSGKTDMKTMLRKMTLNPGIISLLIGFTVFSLSIKLPSPLTSAVNYIADLNTPVAMILIGTFVARAELSKAFTNPKIYLVSFLRLFIVPLLMIPFYILLRSPYELTIANFVATACPIAALAAMFPALYGYDANYGSGFVTVSTLFSVITIPLMVVVLGYFMA